MLTTPYIRYFGRVLPKENSETVYMDWTLCGFEVEFEGTSLTCTFEASPGLEPSGRFGAGSEPERALWPMIGVVVDDSDELAHTFMIDAEHKNVTVYQVAATGAATTTPTRHRVRVVKLTENLKCGLAIEEISTDGTFYPVSSEEKPVIEIIGDSQTCGFGNISPSPNRTFWAEEENGWIAYGPLLARKLGMEPRIIATSGACLALKTWNGRPYGIRDLYEYTDRPREDQIFKICPDSNMERLPDGLPETTAAKWDFASHPAAIAVINLGTNDADGCNYYDDPEEKAREFGNDYRAFLKLVRRLNGPDTKIICALGDMRYYLWDTIKETVESYMRESGDPNVKLLKLHGIKPAEPRGAGGHPSAATDRRMAEQLYRCIRNLYIHN